MFFDKILESGRRGKNDVMPACHQTERERKKWLQVAARTVGEDGDVHAINVTVTSKVTVTLHILSAR